MREIVLNGLEKDFRSNEAYKNLRTNIEFSGEENKVLVFTSCTPNEGKSTVSLSVASSLAESGKKVLFIDADLTGFLHCPSQNTSAGSFPAWKYHMHLPPQ